MENINKVAKVLSIIKKLKNTITGDIQYSRSVILINSTRHTFLYHFITNRSDYRHT
jgi:hypothetical protein